MPLPVGFSPGPICRAPFAEPAMSESQSNFMRTTQTLVEMDDAMPKTVPLRLAPRRTPGIGLARDTVIEPQSRNDDELFTPPSRLPSSLAGALSGPAALVPFDGRPRLRVIRGQKVDVEYSVYDGANFLGRRDERPIDIDLENQEPTDRIWTSRKHAVLYFVEGRLELEDLNSLNGTFVNRARVPPGQRRTLQVGDVIQVGTIQMRVMA